MINPVTPYAIILITNRSSYIHFSMLIALNNPPFII
jgi:hypothetical protein